jgi:serine/threonine protein kinase
VVKRDKGNFLLVYDYMENESLDKWVFECDDRKMLSCEDRIRILKDVASAVLYLHEGWEAKVLHRDIKASNVLLDKDMNGRLGDFGLARMHDHSQVPNTTRVVGTVGYLAPEVIRRTGIGSNRCVWIWCLDFRSNVWEEAYRGREATFGRLGMAIDGTRAIIECP